MSETVVTRNLTVVNPEGLHARAATLIAELVRKHEARVMLVKGEDQVEATEVLQLLSLGAAEGTQLHLEATGPDAEQVADALVRMFASGFDGK